MTAWWLLDDSLMTFCWINTDKIKAMKQSLKTYESQNKKVVGGGNREIIIRYQVTKGTARCVKITKPIQTPCSPCLKKKKVTIMHLSCSSSYARALAADSYARAAAAEKIFLWIATKQWLHKTWLDNRPNSSRIGCHVKFASYSFERNKAKY